MNAYSFAPFLAALLNVTLVLWVFLKAPKSSVRVTFILWNISLALWNIGVSVGYLLPDTASATRWYVFLSAFVVRYIAPLFLSFVFAFTDTGTSRTDRLMSFFAYGSAFVFTIMGLTGQSLMRPAVYFYWGFYPIAGPLEWTYGLVYSCILCYAFLRLFNARKNASDYKRSHISFVLLSAAICFLSGFTNFLPMHGINIYPVGNLVNSLSSLVIAYAIVTYSLLDIRLMLRQSVLHGILAGGLTGVYISLVGILKLIWGHYGGVTGDALYYAAAMPVTVVLAPVMKTRLEPLLQEFSGLDDYPYATVLETFYHSLLNVRTLEDTSNCIVDTVSRWIHRSSTCLYSVSANENLHVLVQRGDPCAISFSIFDPIIQFAFLKGKALLIEKMIWEKKLSAESLSTFPYEVLVPLLIDKQPVGLLAFGHSAHQTALGPDELGVLNTLARPFAMALQSAEKKLVSNPLREKKEQRQQDMALLGLLAAEMAHELTKPLTRIMNEQTRLESVVPDNSQTGLRKIELEARRVSEIINSFTMLSPQQPLVRTPTDIGVLLQEALQTINLKDPLIRVENEIADELIVPLNRQQMSQVFTNIIQNACEAMPEGGALRLSAVIKKEASGDVVEINVEDSGPGVAPEVLDHVFDAFFTTKYQQGGRGVGLTLSQAMVERHEGSIGLESPLTAQGGSRVIIKLPI